MKYMLQKIILDDITNEFKKIRKRAIEDSSVFSSHDDFHDTIDSKDTITLSGDEARRYKIQKKIDGYWYGLSSDIWELYRDLSEWFKIENKSNTRCNKLINDIVKEIGEEDLKWFFGIEESKYSEEDIHELINNNMEFAISEGVSNREEANAVEKYLKTKTK